MSDTPQHSDSMADDQRPSTTVVDRSCCKAFLRRYYFGPLLSLVPISIQPFAITLVGLAACLCIPGVILMGAPPRDRWFSFMCAIAVWVYLTADHLDGMQARRAGSGSYVGAILDHLCDFTNGCMIILGAYWSTGMPFPILMLISALYVIAFSISHCEVIVRNELWLGDELWLGTHTPLEGLIVVMLFFLWSAELGKLFWVFVGYFVYKFVAIILSVFRRIRTKVQNGYLIFVAIVIVFSFAAIFHEPIVSLVFWGVIVVYSAGYVFRLLIANFDEVPFPGVLLPATIVVIYLRDLTVHISWASYSRVLSFLIGILFLNLAQLIRKLTC
jgi:phosphatidylglycerophosphate synthase